MTWAHGSVTGSFGGAPNVPAYRAAKGGVRLMSKTDALLYAADRIHVNSVHPGFIWTPMLEDRLREQGDVEKGRRRLRWAGLNYRNARRHGAR